MSKKILILNGSLSEMPLIKRAKELGFYVVTCGNAPELIGHQYADEYINADYSDKELILKLCKEHNIDRIVSCANDFGVITAAYVAEQLGWPGHDTYENALVLHHKDKCKAFIQSLGIPCPFSTILDSKEKAVAFAKKAEYPIIVKAVDLTGGKGIHRANDIDEAVKAIDDAFARSRCDRIVIEPFLIGEQQSLISFVKDKKVIASVSNNVFCPINPYLIQTETLPALGIEKILPMLHEIVEKICKALNLVDGMFTLQYIVKDGVPYVIEMMRRCLGNQYLTVAGAVTGFPWEDALIKAETGMNLDDLEMKEKLSNYAGHHGIMATRNGRVKSYKIHPELEKHLFQKIEIIPPGGEIKDYMNERIAYLYYKYDDQLEMFRMAQHVNDLIDIQFDD